MMPPMAEPAPDLGAYFARLGFADTPARNVATLQALHRLHVAAIPFENLDVLLGRGIRIDLPAIEQKLVRDCRGGYCFEQNTLFAAVLRALGFPVTALLARVRWQAPADYRAPLTHMVLRVEAGGRPWLADVGFGGVGSTAPLALDTADEQATPHEPRRIRSEGARFMHQILGPEGWADVYEFTLEEPAPFDFEMGNWFSCTHPQARFMNNLVATRALPDRRLILMNREFTVRRLDGSTEKHAIETPDALLALLARHFDLSFPPGTRFGRGVVAWPT